MRHLHKAITLLTVLFALAACDDNTATLGIHSDSDGITNSTQIYQLTTRSLQMDSVVANSTISYLGSITDPETGTTVDAQFAAQFYTFENYQYPARQLMVGDVDGKPTRGILQCDSCEVRLYFNDYYGYDNNPMKLEVYEMGTDKILSEDSTYYTDVDLTQYLPSSSKPLATRVFTPRDYNVDDVTLSGSTYNPNLRVMLPASLGQRIIERYYENPNNYRDSYHFIRNVFPGLYFRTTSGHGTMLSVYVGTLNVFYRYADEQEDTVYDAVTRFAATPEVIQSTQFATTGTTSLLDPSLPYTYLKTPAGICTEMTLPVDEVFSTEHVGDSVSLATVTLTRYNKTQDDRQLGTPATLLMVRKSEMHRFFRDRRVADGRTSFTTTFDSSRNTYTFDNIGRLLAYCKHEKMSQAAAQGISEETWAAQHPDWNRVVLVPVVTSTNSSGAMVSVTHDLGLGSIRLVGGTTPIQMQIVYSKFQQ